MEKGGRNNGGRAKRNTERGGKEGEKQKMK